MVKERRRISHRVHRDRRDEIIILSLCSLCSLWLILLLSFTTARAQSTDNEPPHKPSHFQWTLSLTNRTGLRLDEPRVLQMSRTMLDIKAIYKFNDRWQLTVEGRAHYDPIERLGYPKRVWFEPRQVLLDGKIKRVGISLGLQQT